MFIIVVTNENNKEEYFNMLAGNGIYVDSDIKKAVIFSSSAIAIKQKDVLNSFKPDETFVVKEIVLEDLNS